MPGAGSSRRRFQVAVGGASVTRLISSARGSSGLVSGLPPRRWPRRQPTRAAARGAAGAAVGLRWPDRPRLDHRRVARRQQVGDIVVLQAAPRGHLARLHPGGADTGHAASAPTVRDRRGRQATPSRRDAPPTRPGGDESASLQVFVQERAGAAGMAPQHGARAAIGEAVGAHHVGKVGIGSTAPDAERVGARPPDVVAASAAACSQMSAPAPRRRARLPRGERGHRKQAVGLPPQRRSVRTAAARATK